METTHGSPNPSGNGKGKSQRNNWKKMALELQSALEEREHQLVELQTKYESLRRKGLSEREQVQLRQLRYMQRALMNLQVSEASREVLDRLLEEMKYV